MDLRNADNAEHSSNSASSRPQSNRHSPPSRHSNTASRRLNLPVGSPGFFAGTPCQQKIASALAEGQTLPADTSQQNETGSENPAEQTEERKFTQAELDEKVPKRLAKAERRAKRNLHRYEQKSKP